MTDVLFGQAYALRLDPKAREARQPYAPLGTLYAAAHARARGFSVALFDAMQSERDDEWHARVVPVRPRASIAELRDAIAAACRSAGGAGAKAHV